MGTGLRHSFDLPVRASSILDRVRSLRRVIDAALARLAEVGADPDDDEETRRRKALLVLIAVLVLPISLLWAGLYLAFGSPVGYVPLLYFAISLGSVVLFARTRDFGQLLRIQQVAILLAPTLSMIPLGGFLGAAGVGIWGTVAPMGALVFGGVRSGVRWYAAFLAIFLVSGIAGTVLGFESSVPEWFTNMMLGLNISVGGTMVFTLLALFAKQRDEAMVALRHEQERAESLLLNILPGSIAERLKANPKRIADQFPAASVLFADVVDFTPRSENLPPSEIVGMLDRLFCHFDTLAERHGLQKIKTIGDCYMVASGVPTPRPDHARALALLALDMVEATQSSEAVGDLGFQMRVGINSGPVVAGVIGRKRFLYDLWGDAVNTASRMESQGTANHIQITRATYELLKDEFVCEPRGTVAIKGKGDMETWYLVGRRADLVDRVDPVPASAPGAPAESS
jgi:adenylate cyclase